MNKLQCLDCGEWHLIDNGGTCDIDMHGACRLPCSEARGCARECRVHAACVHAAWQESVQEGMAGEAGAAAHQQQHGTAFELGR